MRSRAHVQSHPLHPILVGFPIAFFTGTLVFDLIAVFSERNSLHETAFYMLIAGVYMALLAAVPGFIDYLYTVPPRSSGKKRATTHALVNLCMVALFSIALSFRSRDEASAAVFISLETAGFVLMLVAGWMGGTLVHRNQIGVDPRYAFAGKWKELTFNGDVGTVNLGSLGDLKRDQMMLVRAGDKRIVVGRTEEGIVAFDDHCTHRGGSLAGGMMICGTVQCPWHGSQFDVKSGEVKAGPAKQKISSYKIETVGNSFHLTL
jgi:uncharacterized membrane protein/nitrite reductase/ring-hydroxylating ferredoxin subunit